MSRRRLGWWLDRAVLAQWGGAADADSTAGAAPRDASASGELRLQAPALRVAAAAAIVASYFVAGKVGLLLAFSHSSVSPVWPASGIAVAALVAFGLRMWPAIFAAAFFVNVTDTGHVAVSIMIGAGNTLEAVAGAWFGRRFARGLHAFSTIGNLVPFLVGAGLLAPMVAATVGVASLWAAGLAGGPALASLWATWWLGDVGGILILAPPLLLWADLLVGSRFPPTTTEEWLALLAATASGALAFAVPWPPGAILDLAPLALLPVLVWTAYRLGPRPAATCLLIVDVIAVAATVTGRGPLVLRTVNDSLLVLQVFVALVSAATLGLANLAIQASKDPAARIPRPAPPMPYRANRLRASPRLVLFLLALLPILLTTSAAGAVTRNLEAGLVDARFDQLQRNAADRFVDALERHADRLYGVKGLFEGSDEVTRGEFHTFVNVTGWRQVVGLQGVAFIRHVPGADREAYQDRVRNDTSLRPEGYPGFHVHPEGNRSEYFVVEYIEPMASNEAAFGFDIGAEAERRDAVGRAIASGRPAATGALTLVQGSGSQKGILVLLPVYRGGDPGPSADRRATLIGLVDTVHPLGEMLAELAADTQRMSGPLNFELYDAPPPTDKGGLPPPGALAYDSDGTPFGSAAVRAGVISVAPLDVFGQSWTLVVERPRDLLTPAEAGAPWFLLAAGGVLTLAMVAFTHYQREVYRRRDLAGALRQAEQMNEFKSNLLNTASHELNTPIGALRLQVYLLHQALTPESAPRIKDGLDLLDRNVNRLAALVGDTLDVARVQSGKLEIRPTKVNLQPLLDDVVATYRPVAAKANVELSVVTTAAPWVWADGARITQVMNNLVSNAIKFTPAQGRVDVAVSPEGPMVLVEVRDSGLGLEADQISRLFQPFGQVHDVDAGKFKGTGLGLYISKSIVEQHGGRLWAESQGRDRGSVFRFTIPRKEDA